MIGMATGITLYAGCVKASLIWPIATGLIRSDVYSGEIINHMGTESPRVTTPRVVTSALHQAPPPAQPQRPATES